MNVFLWIIAVHYFWSSVSARNNDFSSFTITGFNKEVTWSEYGDYSLEADYVYNNPENFTLHCSKLFPYENYDYITMVYKDVNIATAYFYNMQPVYNISASFTVYPEDSGAEIFCLLYKNLVTDPERLHMHSFYKINLKFEPMTTSTAKYFTTIASLPVYTGSRGTVTEFTPPESTAFKSITSKSTTFESTASESTSSKSTASESTASESTASESTTSKSTTSESTASESTASESTTSKSTTNNPDFQNFYSSIQNRKRILHRRLVFSGVMTIDETYSNNEGGNIRSKLFDF